MSLDLERALETKKQEHRFLSDELSRSLTETKVLERVMHLFGAPAEFDHVLEGLMDAAMVACDADSGALYLVDHDHNELYFAAARGPKAKEVLALDIRIKPGQGLAGASFLHKETIAVSEVHKDPRFFKEVSGSVGYEVRSLLTAPIVNAGEPYGAIQVINKKGSDEFGQAEVDLMKRLGRWAGALLGLGLELRELRHRQG